MILSIEFSFPEAVKKTVFGTINVCMDSKNHVQRKIMFVFIN